MNRIASDISKMKRVIATDFLSEIRRYKFIVSIIIIILIGISVRQGQIVLRYGMYRPQYDSAGIGAAMAVISTILLVMFGFYFYRGILLKDNKTGVTEILEAMHLNKFFYCAGKWLSTLLLMGVTLFIIIIFLTLDQLILEGRVNVALVATPFIFIFLPAIFMVSAIIVLFDTVPFLRKSFGNILYFVLSTVYLGVSSQNRSWGDITGLERFWSQFKGIINGKFSNYNEITGFYFMSKQRLESVKWVEAGYDSIFIAQRLVWILFAVLTVCVSAIILSNLKYKAGALVKAKKNKYPKGIDYVETVRQEAQEIEKKLVLFEKVKFKNNFVHIIKSELGILLKGTAWWWFVIIGILLIASLALDLEISREYIWPVLWGIPVLILPSLGLKDMQYNVDDIVYSSAYVIRRKVLAMLISGVIVNLVIGSGMLIKSIVIGDQRSICAAIINVFLIPAIALFCSTFCKTEKVFQSIYIILWYYGPVSKQPRLDFIGITGDAVIKQNPYAFIIVGLLLLVIIYNAYIIRYYKGEGVLNCIRK